MGYSCSRKTERDLKRIEGEKNVTVPLLFLESFPVPYLFTS